MHTDSGCVETLIEVLICVVSDAMIARSALSVIWCIRASIHVFILDNNILTV